MGMRDNYLFASPYADRISKNLGTIVFGDPGAARRREVQDAQIRSYDARTREVERKTAEARAEAEAVASMGSMFRNAIFEEGAGPNPDGAAGVLVKRSPADIERRLPDVLGGSASAYRDKPGAIGEIFRVMGALSGDDSLARRGMAAAGNSPSQHFAISPERADAISARDADEQRNRELAVEDVRESGRNTRHGSTEKRLGSEFTSRETRLGRQFEAAETGRNAREGVKETGRTAREELKEDGRNERAGTAEEGRTARTVLQVDGANSRAADAEAGRGARFEQREQRMGDEFTRGEEGRTNRTIIATDGANSRSADTNATRRDIAGEAEAGRNARHDRPRATQPRPGRPAPKLSPKDAAALEDQAFAAVGGTPDMKASALSNLTAEERAGLNAAIADEWARSSGNSASTAAAGGKYLDGILQLNKNEVEGVGSIFNAFRGPSLDRRAPGAPKPAAPSPQAPPAAVPPPDQREVGRVYDTPRGPMIWTGSGWKPAGA